MERLFLAFAVTALAATQLCAQSVSNERWRPLPGVNGRIHWGDADRPAVLLFHGLGASGVSTWVQPSGFLVNYDYANKPGDRSLGEHDSPRLGGQFHEFGTSNMLEVDSRNWFDFLANQGCTVAMWDQPGRTFGEALPSALAAVEKFIEDTKRVNRDAPPPVALLGHSRGGLLIRAVLKAQTSVGRIRWAITLHTPHAGSDMAALRYYFSTSPVDELNLGPLNPSKNELIMRRDEVIQGIMNLIGGPPANNPAQEELRPGSPLLTDLANGEGAILFVTYITFGGTNSKYARLYSWNFNGSSSEVSRTQAPNCIPCTLDCTDCARKFFYNWSDTATELIVISPFNRPSGDVPAEVIDGQGDGLVTGASSRLSFADPSLQFINPLNHAEVLWDRGVQDRVVSELLRPQSPVGINLNPRFVTLGAGQSQRFAVDPPGIVRVRFSIDGAGSIDQDGLYRAPSSVDREQTVTVRAAAVDGSRSAPDGTITLRANATRQERSWSGRFLRWLFGWL
jgi:predicted esterase